MFCHICLHQEERRDKSTEGRAVSDLCQDTHTHTHLAHLGTDSTSSYRHRMIMYDTKKANCVINLCQSTSALTE